MQTPSNPNPSSEKLAERLRAMFGMHDAGIEMLRCRLRRENPQATPAQINQQTAAYLRADRHDPAVFNKRACSKSSATS